MQMLCMIQIAVLSFNANKIFLLLYFLQADINKG